MNSSVDKETWVIEAGDSAIRKKARVGLASLSPWETLVYCLWVADYGMRNAGDLDVAEDLYSGFHSDARRIAADLSLPLTYATFALSKDDLEDQYFDRFDPMVHEIRHFRVAALSDGR